MKPSTFQSASAREASAAGSGDGGMSSGHARITRRTVLKAGAVTAAVAAAQPLLAGPRAPRAAAAGGPSPIPFDFADDPPFSFTYGGTSSRDPSVLPAWPRTAGTTVLDANRTQQTVTWTDPVTGLQVQCVSVTYSDYPVVEWTVHFTNTGPANSPALAEVLSIDTVISGTGGQDWTIHTANGSEALATDFQPADITLSTTPGLYKLFSTGGGRPTSGNLSQDAKAPGGAWPYYNLDWNGAGAIVAIAWPGQWGLQLGLDPHGNAPIIGGMTNYDGPFSSTPTLYDLNLTDMYLTPGEQIRTPLIVTMTWAGGDWIDAQNVWRSWFLVHNCPRPNGSAPSPVCPTGSVDDSYNFVNDTTQTELAFMAAYHDHGLTPAAGGQLNWWWMDAGWYPIPSTVSPSDLSAWTYTGTWTPDLARYPNGIIEVTNQARADGMKAIVWHEPERCRPGTDLYNHHPDWLLTVPSGGDATMRYVDVGNPDALAWMKSTFDGLITSNGADLFRQDFNYTGPLPYWNSTDPAGRQGATQVHYVMGLLDFWDTLRANHPGMLIDTCASGGRRLDLETLRRCIVLSESDYIRDPEAAQAQYYGLSLWVVCHGTSANTESLYSLRSAMNWCFEAHFDNIISSPPSSGQWATLKTATDEWATFCDSYLGEFYPLTAWSYDQRSWLAYQYHRPDLGTGLVQCFARTNTPGSPLTVALRGLDATATYQAYDVDHPSSVSTFTGSQLMTAGSGISVAPVPRPYAVNIVYRKV